MTYMLQKIIPTISNAKAYQLTMTTHCEGVSTVSQTAKQLAQKYCPGPRACRLARTKNGGARLHVENSADSSPSGSSLRPGPG